MNYLSFGGGVNSTAMMLLLQDQEIDFKAVFVDTGCEWPETYQFLEYLKKRGYEFTWLKPVVEDTTTLYDYLLKWRILPSIFVRCCTSKFKTGPFNNYIEKPCTVFIGYDYGEYKRRHLKDKEGITYKTPLVDNRLTRRGCIEYIKKHDLRVPPKSGCWFCPFQGIKGFKRLRNTHPELFEKAISLEEANPRDFTILNGTKLSALFQKSTLSDWIGRDGELSCSEWKCRE
jgi:3'-phosphoadenosine 5'-phosphosulfate sulfotransferase (PAPS reductase)/FAD synthetase